MSKETLEWLNQNVLIGFTERRGTAWHYRRSAQGEEPNHYPGAIPQKDVRRRLFDWEPLSAPLYVQHRGSFVQVPGKKAIMHAGTKEVLEVHNSTYEPHDYNDWLLDTVAQILDDRLSIGSAGLLRGGRQAFVSVEVPENIITPEGVEFRPNLLAVTSLDGSLATTYKRIATNVVCDNTMAIALSEKGQTHRTKHTVRSLSRIHSVRDALGIVYGIADDFSAQIKELTRADISVSDFDRFLTAYVPISDDDSKITNTRRINKRDAIRDLYQSNPMVAPWRGTGYGVLQAVNTYVHHFSPVRGKSRVERNLDATLNGSIEKLDREVLDTMRRIEILI